MLRRTILNAKFRNIILCLQVILFVLVSGISKTKIAYAGNGLTSKQATQILKEINPHIISYNINTHEVKYDDGTSVFVTPPNGKTRNGEVSWKYFLEQKGDLRGWLKMNLSGIIAQKRKYIAESKKSFGHTIKAKALAPRFVIYGLTSYIECNRWYVPASY